MAKNIKTPTSGTESFCQSEIDRMLKYSQTKVIMPVVTLGLLRMFKETGKRVFSDTEIKRTYEAAVKMLKEFLGHDVHLGAKYYDAYGLRMSRYSVLKSVGHLRYELLVPYTTFAESLCLWIPPRIKRHIEERLGVVPLLGNASTRMSYAEDRSRFLDLIRGQIVRTPANFEIFSFAVIKVHLERFACKIYRDTRTSAHDKGVDLSTNFGVVYQVKKLNIHTESEAKRILAELKGNFDSQRFQDGNVILVVDDISKGVKKFLIDMKVQSISKEDLLKLASNFDDSEDRQKVLRIVYEEFRREYSSAIK
ncbi:MAG: HaeII family restriction endonuclease [Verrucomicrobia bacterium]|nr:HaeII family restriction endonuclease [Verrucomicrobiota bacterium]